MKWLAHRDLLRAAVIAGAIAQACVAARSQALRVRPIIRPRANDLHPNSLTVGVSPAMVMFALSPGAVAQGSSGITITTTWDSGGTPPALTLYGYFNSSTAALSDGYSIPDLIPTSSVLGQMTTGVPTSYSAFTQTTGFGAAGASLTLLNIASGTLAHSGVRTDVLNLEIDLTNLRSLPAGVYSGTLVIQASIQ